MRPDLQNRFPRAVCLAGAPLLSRSLATAIRRETAFQLAAWPTPDAAEAVVIGTPLAALGALLQAGMAPHEALPAWTAAARALLEALEQAPDPLQLVLVPREGGEVALGERPRRLVLPPDGTAPWWIAAAGLLIGSDEAARMIAGALRGRAGLPEAEALTEASAVTQALQRLFPAAETVPDGTVPAETAAPLSGPRLEARLAMTVETIDRLQAALGAQLGALERVMAAEVETEQDLARLRERLSAQAPAQEQLEALQASLAEQGRRQRRRETLLGARLLDDLDDRRRMSRLIQDYERWSQALQADVEALRAELDKVYGSKSWKLTSPLRSLRHSNPAS